MRKLLTLTLAMLISVSWLGAQDYSAKKNMRRVDFSKDKKVTLSKEKEEFSRIEAENYIPSTPEEQISFKSSKGEVTIGTGTVTTLNLPIACNWGYNYSQTIYYQTEIGEAGDITKLYYKWNGSGDAENIKLWNVYMGHTPKTTFESTTDWIPFSELTEVFNGEIEFETAVDNWIEITLSTPFAYDNTNNLVIAVDENTPGYSSLPKFLGTSTTGVNRGILYRNDSTNPDPENPPTASSVVAGYANIKLRFPPSIPYLFDVSAETGATVMAGGSYDYAATVKNMGINADAFTLAITGSGAWTYEFFESDGTTPLVNPINIASDVSANFVIKVTVPATGVADGDTDTQEFSVTSAEGGKAVENFSITTTATTPLYLPIYDGFEEGNTNQQPVASWDMVKVTGTEGWLANSAQTSYNRTPRTGSFNAHLKYSNTAWLFTKKPVALEAEKLYRFSLYARQDAASGASITLKYGTSASDAGMTFDIKEATDVVNGDYQLIEGEFSPDTDGGYYLGILGVATYTPWYLSIDDISVTEVAANDVSVSQLVTPSGIMSQGNTYPMSVTVTNEGTNPQPAGVSVSFKQEGVEFATAATTVDLATGESEVVTANYTATALGTFAIEASVAADENPANDMVSGSITIFQAGALFEDFEGDFLPNGWTETATENSWSQEDRDINGLSAFLIHDISNAEEMLITPKLTLDGTVNELSYWADDGNGSYGYGSAQIQIKYSADGIDWTDVGDLAILDADDPVQFIVDLSAIPNGDYYFAFATSSTFEHEGYNSLTAIDDVAGPVIADLLANDLSIAALDYPREFIYDGEDLSIFVNVKNVGTAFQTGVELTLSVDGVEAETHTLGSLGYGQSEIVEFSFIAVAGRYTFTATLAADDNLENNTRTTQGVVVAEGQLAEGFEGTWVPTLWEAETGWRYWDQDWTAQWEGVRSAACGNTLGISDSKLITPFLQIGENEELNFYATVGNEIEGTPTTIQVMYSADKEEWTAIGDLIELTDKMVLYSIDLSSITGQYFLAFSASGAPSGATWATWAIIDHVVGPDVVPFYEVTINTTDQDAASLSGVTVEYNGVVSGSVNTVSGTAKVMLCDGTYTYTATRNNYYETTGTIVVDGDVVTENIQLNMYPLVSFSVTSLESAPLAGVSIEYLGATTEVTGVVNTITGGTRTVRLPADTYSYTASVADYYDVVGSFTVADEDVTEEIVMQIFPTVTFTVKDVESNPITAAIVTVTGYDAITTDAAGEATKRIPNGEHTGTAYKIGFLESPVAFTVADNTDMDVDITLTVAPPTLGVDVNEYQFAATEWHTSSTPKVFTIQNIGDGTLTINPEDITISGDDAAYFELTTLSEQASLTVGQTATFSVVFSPTVEGVLSAVIEIEDNQGKGVTEIAISGESVDPTINVFPYSETFEGETFPALGWRVHQQDAVVKQWESSTDFNHTDGGSKSARHMYGSGDHDGWLVMPAIEVPAEGVYKLSFWSWNIYPSDYDKNSVLISTGSSDPSDTDYVEVWTPTSVTASWVRTTIDLTTYAGETIYVAFRYEGNFAHTWHVDDVEIQQYCSLDLNVLPVADPVAGVLTGAGTYPAGQVVAVNAVANEGYQFIDWTDANADVVSTTAAFDYTLNADVVLTANFMAFYDVTFTVTDGTDPIVSAAVTINELDMGVTDATGVLVASLSDGIYDYTITADGFAVETGQVTVAGAAVAENVVMIPIYEVTFSVVGGNGTLAASFNSTDVNSGDLVPEGSNVEFAATPADNYRVKEWKLDSEVVDGNTTNSYTVTNLMAATNVTVEFEVIPETTYEVTFSVVGGNGTLAASASSVDVSSGDLVPEGSNVEFTATPADNYRVKEWKLGSEVIDGNTTNSYTVTNLMAATNVTVEFEVIPETTYEVTFSVVGGNGTLAASASSVDVSSGDLVPEGSNIVFTATPDEEYEVKEWRLNSEVVDENTTNSYTVSNLMAATDVTVEFKLIVGVNTNALANLKVYPNPFSNEINITSDRVNRVIITNIVGQRVMDITLNGLETINTSELSNGIYLVTFEGTNGEQTVRKMIKK